MQYVIGSWYKADELGKRACIFHVYSYNYSGCCRHSPRVLQAAGSVGMIFTGFMQAAAYEGLNGVHGLSGWRCKLLCRYLAC